MTTRASIARSFLAGLSHALLMWLAFPPIGLWGAALAASLPAMWAAWAGRDHPLRAWMWFAIGSFPFWLVMHLWVWDVSVAGCVPFAAVCAVVGSFPVCALGWVVRRRTGVALSIVGPVAWVGVEFFRGVIAFDGYPLLLVGHPLIDAPVLWPLASLGGVWLVSLAVVIPAGAAADLLTGRGWRWPAGALAVFCALAAMSLALDPRAAHGPGFRVGVAQTNVPQLRRTGWGAEAKVEAWRTLQGLTDELLDSDPPPDLVVWPETMFPGGVLNEEAVAALRSARLEYMVKGPDGATQRLPVQAFAEALVAYQGSHGVPMLVGAAASTGVRFEGTDADGYRERFDKRYNSAFLVAGGRVSQSRYDKMHLTPFGEVMPYISSWPWLERQLMSLGANGMTFDLSAGTKPVVLEVPRAEGGPIRVGTPICYESATPWVCRALVGRAGHRRVDVLINLTNEGWFGSDLGARLRHQQAARWRCVELATPMVRVANTGISSVIDARGRVIRAGVGEPAQIGQVEGVLRADVPGPGPMTMYARFGGVAGWAAFVSTLILLGVGVFGGRSPPARAT